MKLDRIVVVGEGPADLQVIPILVKRWVRQGPSTRSKDARVRRNDTYLEGL